MTHGNKEVIEKRKKENIAKKSRSLAPNSNHNQPSIPTQVPTKTQKSASNQSHENASDRLYSIKRIPKSEKYKKRTTYFLKKHPFFSDENKENFDPNIKIY